ncbi:MAG: hypothetical protein Q8M76_06620, partial [Spirochaetaceae bacterium]|nr:hypothetical protein [Spirochaetaceae bacterium]
MSRPEARAHNLEGAQAKVLSAIDGCRSAVASASRAIWERPETGGRESYASALAMGVLRDAGFEVEGGFGGIPTAFLARKGCRGGPKVAFLAEYDALP